MVIYTIEVQGSRSRLSYEHLFTRECITKSLQENGEPLQIMAFENCADCLRSTYPHDLILYHLHESLAGHHTDQHDADIKRLMEVAPL